jgi:NAD(P)-dependent dehydrogenase (short-subunit alcohol dehydrogenase family)
MSSARVIYVVGSGPMVGSHVARLFATHSFTHLALFSRSPSDLSRDASFITSTAPSASVHTYSADVTDHVTFKAALERAVSEVGVPEVVVYNAARINYGIFGQYPIEDIVTDFKVPNLGLYTTASVLLPHLQALAKSDLSAKPSLFVTSGAIIHQPFPPLFSLSMAKAAQASLVKLLADENKDVVHVALVTIGGQVTPDEKVNNPSNIATKFWELYEQKKGSWEFEKKCEW